MFCGFIRTHCYKVAITALAVLVFFEYGFGVFYEENRRINEAYFTFNLTAPRLSGAAGTYNDTDFNYAATANMTLIALQSSNSSDPYQLDLLADSLNFTRKPLMCPLVSPLLVGRMNVSKVAMPMNTFEEKYGPLLGPGGRYHPPNCQAHYKVAIIIPYRKREEHLQVFIQHMHPFLQRQQIDYGIFVVEQSGETPFNRAMLMNIGAAEALRQDGFQCFVFHDVDLLPEDDRNTYSCPEQPRHMSVAIDVFKYRLPYEGLFGGVSAMTTEHFIKVNGFSNLFWGWGGEDDDMSSRIKYHKLIISRYPPSTARYTMLSHKKARPNPNRYRVMRNGAKRSKVDGLSNLKYKRLDLQMNPLYIHILGNDRTFGAQLVCDCAVICYGGKEEWNWAWRASLCDMWSSQRKKILSAMSCSQDRDRLKQLLSRVFSPTIEQDPHDTFATIEKMTENHVARSMVLNFLATNWEILARHFSYRRSGDNLKLLTSAAKCLSTPDELKEMSRILSDLENKDKKLNRAFTNGILEGIRNNIRWGEKNLEQVYLLYLVIESGIMTRRKFTRQD